MGLPNLRWLNFAMRARWLWLKRVNVSRPWAAINIQVPPESHAIYQAAVFMDIGDGRTSFFSKVRWLQGMRVHEIAPRIYDRIRPAMWHIRTVADAVDGVWPQDVCPDLNADEIHEYFQLWDIVLTVELQEGMDDQVRWAWESTRQYTTGSAYACRFFGWEHDLASSNMAKPSSAPV